MVLPALLALATLTCPPPADTLTPAAAEAARQAGLVGQAAQQGALLSPEDEEAAFSACARLAQTWGSLSGWLAERGGGAWGLSGPLGCAAQAKDRPLDFDAYPRLAGALADDARRAQAAAQQLARLAASERQACDAQAAAEARAQAEAAAEAERQAQAEAELAAYRDAPDLQKELLRHGLHAGVDLGARLAREAGESRIYARLGFGLRGGWLIGEAGGYLFSGRSSDAFRGFASAGVAPLTVAAHPGGSHLTLLEPSLSLRYTTAPLVGAVAGSDPTSKRAGAPPGGFSAVAQTRLSWGTDALQGLQLEGELGLDRRYWGAALSVVVAGTSPHESYVEPRGVAGWLLAVVPAVAVAGLGTAAALSLAGVVGQPRYGVAEF